MRATLSTGIGLGIRASVQAVIFIIISRALGVENYGGFAAIFALASVFGGFGALGSQFVMLRDVSRSRDVFAAAWGKTLLTISLATPLLLVAYLVLTSWFLAGQMSMAAIALVGIAEIILTPLGLSAVTAYQAHERMGRAARLTLFPVLPRLVAAIALWILSLSASPASLLQVWASLYVAAAVISTAYAQYLVHRDLGPARWPRLSSIWPTVRQGFDFVAASTAARVHNDIDKPMLSRLSTLEQTGAYSAGYRVVDLVIIPITSLLTATWPRFFREGGAGEGDLLKLARSLVMLPALYAVGIAAVLYLASGFVTIVLGPEFADSSNVLRWLACLPLVSLPRLLMQMVLTSSDRQRDALVALGVGAAANILLNLYLIPKLGWQGAVVATYASEALMTAVMAIQLRPARTGKAAS